MLGAEFRGLAEAVTRTYGDDPWFFLRELAQNSRDAGARRIRVAAETSATGTETLTFEDDGRGMTLAHARRYLFRLFASDKGGDPSAAGCYGIGFWTTLRFRPAVIHLQSRHGDDSWAVTLDAGLNARPAPCSLTRPGTVVALTRPAACPSPEEFARQVEGGLRTYCRYLRRNDRRASPLPLWFAGKNLTEPMALPGPLSWSFRSGPVEGAVGLGEKPEVRLFARGLPVWQGAVLSQMSHLHADADVRTEVGGGLAPVFLLNGNHLDVTFTRNLALENKALDLVRKKAEAALRRLLETSLEKTFPRKWQQRLGDRLQAWFERLRRRGWHWLPLILLVLVPLEFVVLRQWFSAPPGGGSSWFSVHAAPMSYRGAVVSALPSAAAPFFSYAPESPHLFKLFTADLYDEKSGFVRGKGGGRLKAPPPFPCPPSAAMRLRLRAGGNEIFLPLAAGQALLPGSLRLNGRPLTSVFATPQGETIARLPAGGGWVEYRSCPGSRFAELALAEAAHFTALPSGIALPPDLEAIVNASLSASVAERAARSLSLARERLSYDTSAATADSYRRSGGEAAWLARVLRIGRGDCDVINGLQVLLLRKMGIPSRLVIGMVGDAGRARSRLHAWGEYFDRGWVISDATPVAAGVPPGAAWTDAPPPNPGPAAVGTEAPQIARFTPGPGLFLILLAALAGGALYFLARRNRGITALPATAEEIKKPLLQIARQAMLQPALWGADNPLWRHRLLPTVDGAALSLQQAWRLQQRKKLFMTANRNPLALAMAASHITVLDLSQPLYAPLLVLMEGAVDADLLCRLRPEPPVPDNGLLASVNAILGGRRIKPALKVPAEGPKGSRGGSALKFPIEGALCLLAPGLSGADLLHVSLPAPLRDAPFFFPQHFIAVAPGGKSFCRAVDLFRRNQPLAVIRFLRRLAEEGLLEGASAPRLLKKTARRLLVYTHD